MVLPLRQKEIHTTTVEELIMERLRVVFQAIDHGDGSLFDRATDGIEMLLKLRPSVYNQLQEHKKKMNDNITIIAEDIAAQAGKARNEIQRRAFFESEMSNLEWDARNDYLEKIIEVLGRNQLVTMESVEPAVLEQVEEEKIEEEEEDEDEEEIEEEDEEPEPKPEPKQKVRPSVVKKKKPKLSIPRKMQEFDL